MSYEMEALVQAMDDEEERYHRALQGCPEYWSELVNKHTATEIAPRDERERFSVSGEVSDA